MTGKIYDIVALSAACVDIQIAGDDELLVLCGMKKGLSNAVAPETLGAILGGNVLGKSPGSPGINVTSGVSLRGGAAALIGKIANDDLGAFLTKRVTDNGTAYTPVITEDAATGCLAAVTTSDKERTFAFLPDAACYRLAPEDIDETLIAQSKLVYLDAFLWLSESGRAAIRHAAEIAKKNDTKVVMALNNADLVAHNREAFFAFACKYADILVGDRREFMALLDEQHLGKALLTLNDYRFTASLTMGAQGAYILHAGELTAIPAQKLSAEEVIDTNGAGDQFAAGFLFGIAQGKTAKESGLQGAAWASDVIRHLGAEPKVGRNAPPPAPKP